MKKPVTLVFFFFTSLSLSFGQDFWQEIFLPDSIIPIRVDFDQLVNSYLLTLDGILRSSDNGITWNNILPGYIVTSLEVDINGGIYAGCDSDFGPEGVQFSSDNGLAWESINSGLHDNASITSLAISPNEYIYATTVFPSKLYRSINPVVSVNVPEKAESALQIFPNLCSDVIYIKNAVHSVQSSELNYFLEVINIKSEAVFAKSGKNCGDGIISCDVSSLNPGLYLSFHDDH